MKTEYIFQSNPRWPSCHASTIGELENGELVAAWFAGTKEASADSVILGAKKFPGGAWSEAVTWVNVDNRAVGNPKLFTGPDQNLWLIAPINYGKWCQGGTRLFNKRSYDNAVSWTDLELLYETPRILGKNKPLKLNNDVWIIPVEEEVEWRPAFLRSEDDGRTWDLITVPPSDARVIQPTVVQLADETLLAYARSWEGHIYQMRSFDQGLSWTVPTSTLLPNNNSGIDMVRLASGNLILVYNPTGLGERVRGDGGKAWGPRNPYQNR